MLDPLEAIIKRTRIHRTLCSVHKHTGRFLAQNHSLPAAQRFYLLSQRAKHKLPLPHQGMWYSQSVGREMLALI